MLLNAASSRKSGKADRMRKRLLAEISGGSWNLVFHWPPLLSSETAEAHRMSTKICDKCNKAAAVLIPLEVGTSVATAKYCPQCYERIHGKEELEEALKAREDQESKKPDHKPYQALSERAKGQPPLLSPARTRQAQRRSILLNRKPMGHLTGRVSSR
jgi:hypothetical protein